MRARDARDFSRLPLNEKRFNLKNDLTLNKITFHRNSAHLKFCKSPHICSVIDMLNLNAFLLVSSRINLFPLCGFVSFHFSKSIPNFSENPFVPAFT